MKPKLKDKFYKILKKYYIYIIIIGSILADCLVKIDKEKLKILSIADITLILLPLIITIICISLQMPNDKICGISSMDFRRLRKRLNYSIQEMIFITISIFSLYTIFRIIKFNFSCLAIDIISLYYCIFFSYLEIPLLCHKKETISNIIKQSDFNENLIYDFREIDNKTNCNKVVLYCLFNYGINTTFGLLRYDKNKEFYNKKKNTISNIKKEDEKLKIKNGNLLVFLLSLQNFQLEYLNNILQSNVKDYDEHIKNIDLISIMKNSTKNLEDVIKTCKNSSNIILNNDNFIYQFSNSIILVNDLSINLNISNLYFRELNSIILEFFSSIRYEENNQEIFYSILNRIIFKNIYNNGNIWFLEFLINNCYAENLIYPSTIEYFVFISILLYQILLANSNDLEKINMLNKFFKNHNFTAYMHDLFYGNHEKNILNILPKLLRIFDLTKSTFNGYLLNYSNGFNDYEYLTKKDIIYYWIEMIFYLYGYDDVSSSELDELMNKLKYKEKYDMCLVFNEKVFDNDNVKEVDKDSSFIKFYLNCDLKFIDNSIFKYFKDFTNEFLSNKNLKELEKQESNDSKFDDKKQIIINKFNTATKKSLNKFNFNNETFADDGMYIKKSFAILFDRSTSMFERMDLENEFRKIIYKLCNDDFLNNIQCLEFSKSNIDELNEKIKEYEVTKGNITSYEINSYGIKIKDYILSNSNNYLPFYVLWKDNSIFIDIKCDKSLTKVRKLTPDEINFKIDNHYEMYNGLYKYVNFNNCNEFAFVNRETIYELINKRYFISQIVFDVKIVYDKKHIIYFKLND